MISIRPEISADIAAIRHINIQAFGRDKEAVLVDKLRKRGVLTLSLVAVRENKVVGHIAFSPVVVKSKSSQFEAITLAPIAVLPEHQRCGIGGQLIRAGLAECRNLGHEIVVLAGHPEYYPRFGFVRAKSKGIDCEVEVPDEAWMIIELREGALSGRTGTVNFQSEFKEAF
jgi:putative acetyltransferase